MSAEDDPLRALVETSPSMLDFFETSLDHLCVAGFDGYFKRLNPAWTRTLGWTPDEMMAAPSIAFVHPDDRETTLSIRARLAAGAPTEMIVNRYRCKDGTYRWFEWRSARSERGLVYAVARDVTDAREAQAALRELTDSLAITLDSIADGVIAVDAADRVLRMNPVAERLTGRTVAEALGQPVDAVFVAVEGSPMTCSRAPMRDASGRVAGAVLVLRDTTAERAARAVEDRLNRQLLLADRMASIGVLAAGVAHEINNPLAVVVANLELLLEGHPGGDGTLVTEALQGAERIRKIVRGLNTFSRADEERREVLRLEPVLELSMSLASNELRHRARIVRDYDVVPAVEANDAHLAQVFVNLLVNAAQALPEGHTDSNEIAIATSTDKLGRAVVEVRDTGPGIPEALLGRIFDPFFTTKPLGVGTGLGLSIAHNLVTAMGGTITAANRLDGHGAVLRVVLPPAGAERVAPAAVPAAEAASARASILVVDDDRAVGIALARVLRDHDVTVVPGGRRALDLLLAGTRFDVILSDLMMPEMSGMELYDAVLHRLPDAAATMVFITGGAFTHDAAAFLERVPNERMSKPFEPQMVRDLVARRLDRMSP
jgi:PAS domain S-box-containing protein